MLLEASWRLIVLRSAVEAERVVPEACIREPGMVVTVDLKRSTKEYSTWIRQTDQYTIQMKASVKLRI